jgi:hypothetical protein
MTVLMTFVAMVIVLIVGDFLSTFGYHVPQHLWFTLHLRTHHDRRRSYWDHAVLSKDPMVMLDGILGAVPYVVVAACVWHMSAVGAVLGLVLGQLHVWWRHTVDLGWKTPQWIVAIARPLQIVLPEDHNEHHINPDVEFGDLFRFYDAPARFCLRFVRAERRRRRQALRRLKGESVKA